MGGHGGLNILPQKSWNVYGRENRTKVARDEAKAKKKEAEEEEKHLKAEREYRHKLLLRRAGKEPAEAEPQAPQTADGLLASIFDNTEPESNAEHPENVEKRVEEQRRRGNPDTQTSDAKFDERFAFAFNMGKVQPWYAKEPAATAAADKAGTSGQPSLLQQHLDRQQQLRDAPAAAASTSGSSSESDSSYDKKRSRKRHSRSRKRRRRSSSSSSSESGSESDSSSDDGRSRKRRRRDKQSKKGHKSKSRHKGKGKGKPLAKAGSGVKTIAELREERVQRELAEKARSRSVLRASLAAEELPGVYNTSFGHAAALKRSRAGQ